MARNELSDGLTDIYSVNTSSNHSNIMKSLICIIAAIAFSGTAMAGLVTPAGNLSAGNDNVAEMETNLGISSLTLLYKLEFPKTEGDFGSYFTISDVDVSNPGPTATVSWNLTGSGFELVGIAWKAGSAYLWSGIHPDQYLIGGPHVLNTAPDLEGKELSHISFYGRPGTTSVPDASATLGMLALGLSLLLVARRTKK